MSDEVVLTCCNKRVNVGELWFLEDFKGFTGRKLYVGKCKVCGDDVALQIMTNTKTGKKYYNLYNGIEAVKTIYREKKRKITTFPNIQADSLYGWIYGINIEIKNKYGKTTQIRQYSSDMSGNKKLVKQVFIK